MSSAAQQRLKRTRVAEQMSLELDIPATFDVTAPDAPVREQSEFARLAEDIAQAQPRVADPWADSPYAWLKKLPPARRSAVGQALLTRWLTHCGITHTPRHGDGEHDVTVGAAEQQRAAQIRISTLWAGGDFIFQGLKAGAYDSVLLLGIAPHRVHLWAVPQAVALAHLDSAGWISVRPERPPQWLTPYGGSLTAGARQALA